MVNPSFSIVIPTFQRRDLVCETVRLLEEQRYVGKFEVIVVVDGSTDGTAAALANADFSFPLKIVEQPNGGAAHARNRGAAEAAGDILLFVDDDMTCAANLLEEHARLHHDRADAITGEITPDRALPEGLTPADLAAIEISAPVTPATAFDTFTGQLSVKRSIFKEIAGFDESFTLEGAYGNEDLDFGARLLSRYDLRINPAAITVHRDRSDERRTLRRAKLLAIADVRLLTKHPELAGELLDRRGASAPKTRFLYRPIGGIPLLSPLIAAVVVGIAHLCLSGRPNRAARRLASIAYAASYWSTLSSRGKLFHSLRLR